MLNIDQIKKLKEGATKGPWTCMEKLGKSLSDHGWRLICEASRKGDNLCVYAEAKNMATTDEKGSYYKFGDDAAFIEALPDIADTAIALAEENEELKEEIKRMKLDPLTDNKPITPEWNPEIKSSCNMEEGCTSCQ